MHSFSYEITKCGIINIENIHPDERKKYLKEGVDE